MSRKMKLLIAYDGSECAAAALEDLRWAGLPQEAEAIVLSVSEHWLPPPSAFELAESDWQMSGADKALALAKRAAYSLDVDFPDWLVRAETASGSPARKLIEKADEWQPDLLVVGSHGLTAFGRFILGSVSQKIVTKAHCSVRVARERAGGHIAARDNPVRLLIGVDGSAGAEAAVQSVLQRQWSKVSQARVVNAELRLPPGTGMESNVGRAADWMSSENARVREAVESAEKRLRAIGLETTTVFKEEDPKKLLVSEAESWGADCIFVGAKGMGRFERFVIGSVSATVAARAHCSVEVVRAAT
jgi:nucleotide-binding universal stress UspA family protein